MLKIQLELLAQQLLGGHSMIDKDVKIFIINNMISNIDIHINSIESDKDEWPEEKPSKQSVLDELYNKKTALQLELASVQSS